MATKSIRLTGVRQNNLRNLNVEFPHRQITVVTGLSGSGKSSLAFDTLYAEGQRRYVESLSTYTRQFLEKMAKPDLDRVENIPPAIALEQRNNVVNSRSTVGTQTELIDYLRVLYAKVGRTICLDCGIEVKRLDAQSLLDWALEWLPSRKAVIIAPLLAADAGGEEARKSKSKKAKKSKTSSKTKTAALQPTAAPTWTSILQIVREQGFQRLLFISNPSGALTADDAQIVDVEDLAMGAAPPPGTPFLVIDRVRLGTTADKETRARLLDSIEQGLAIGRGELAFVDLDSHEWKRFDSRYACTQCRREYRVPEPHLFSFNSPMGACTRCSGFGHTLDIDEALVVPDPSKTLKNGAIDPLSKPSHEDWQRDLFRFAERQGISIGKRYSELTPGQKKLLWEGHPEDKTFPGILACFEELKRWKYKLHIRVFIRRYQSQTLCPVCKGARLTPDAIAVKVGNQSLPEVLDLPVEEALLWVRSIPLTRTQRKTAEEVLQQVERRLEFLVEVGVGYLTTSRLAKTLSGGEFQRINLATQLGNGLCGTLYVLDEPSIGLHAADTERLIRVLKRLRDQGNTVVVVEHDLEVMRAADWLIELGPGAGRRGGELVAQGNAARLIAEAGSVTGKYLSGAFTLTRDRPPRPAPTKWMKVTGARENNLKDITVEFPLERFVVVTGVSGSGKSTLVHKTIHNSLAKLFYRSVEPVGKFDRLYGAEQISGVVLLDQSPIGRSSRSNPATYLKAWDEVRRIYSSQTVALRRGFTPQHFSFNVDGGRCPVCKGEGEVTLDMHFMAEVRLPCEECEGRRFKKNVLDVTYRGKNVYQLLQSTIDEAYELFRDHPILARKLGFLREVGLGYLQVGQSGTTLSGGESQRLKIASTLEERSLDRLLYVFDEPTTGLHLEDVKRLMVVIQDLVDQRHSVLMIEHHSDVIAQSDWVVDLGPGGGARGGSLVASAPPGRIFELQDSATGRTLRSQGYSFPAQDDRPPRI